MEGAGAARVKAEPEPAGNEHERGHILEAACCPEDKAACVKEAAGVVKEEAVVVKQELYTDHEVQDGLVLGPVCLQERAVRSETEVTLHLEPESVAGAGAGECGSETAGSSGSKTEQQTLHSEILNWPTLNGVTVKLEHESVAGARAGSCGSETEQLTQRSERQSWPTLIIEPIAGIAGSWRAPRAAPPPRRPPPPPRPPRPPRCPGPRPPAECLVCSKQFKETSKLKEHMRVHTGEKPYPCKTCDKRFARRFILKVHERTHTGEKPFCCEICNKRFRDAHSLKIHDRIHARNPYPCDVCDRNFADPDTLRKHMLFHLSGETEYYM